MENLCRKIKRLPKWLMWNLLNISRFFSHRKGQSPWPGVQLSLTPTRASAMSSSLAQVSALLSLISSCRIFFSLSHFYCYVLILFLQVQRLWCVQRHWGKRVSLIALSCAPWTDILHMTGLNWVRFVHRPRPHKLRKSWNCKQSYVRDCRGAVLVSGAKTGALWGAATLHSSKAAEANVHKWIKRDTVLHC